MKKFNVIIALLLINNLLFADIFELASPQLSASSAYFDSNKTTAVAISNPALTSDIQRYTFDFNYLLLAGLTGDISGLGHSISLGGAMPSKYGVFSSTVDLLLTDDLGTSDLNVGTGTHINLNFSKEIYADLSFGGGLTTILASGDDGFDWGLGLNLGFVKDVGHLGTYATDVRWGVAIRNMGKGYNNSDDFFKADTDVFTPAAFIELTTINTDKFNLDVVSEISFPSFSNMNIEIGARASFLEHFIVDTTTNVDINELIAGDYDSLIPSLFIGYNLLPGSESETSSIYDETLFSLSANPYADGIWAFGVGGTMPIGQKDTTPPEVVIDYEDTQYVSPNFDGTNDELIFPITVEDERYISAYEFTITDSFGNVVKKIINKEERPENESIKNLYNKMVSPKTGIPVPENFRWDGIADSGTLVTDGEYTFQTKFTDDNGNVTITKEYEFIIDVTDPTVELSPPSGLDLIFSPNGDGNKDVLEIPQSSSKEVRWFAEVTDFMGNSVKSEAWDNAPTDKFLWDGKDDSGQLVPDGVYKYKITSTDLAGNSTEDFVDNIIINTKQPPIGITINTNSFSPNNDTVKDNMEFVLDIPVKTGIIQWDLAIKDSTGLEVNRFSTKKQGYSVIEDNIRFNGDDSAGRTLKEGSYSGELSVVYQNGHSPVVESPTFNIDITPPKADVKTTYNMFSPNGDDSKDEMILNQSSTVEEEWLGEVFDEFGDLVFNTSWIGEVNKTFNWDGKNNDGELSEDGLFTYVLSSTDKSGNSYRGESTKFELNTSKTGIELALNRTSFSPGSVNGKVELTAILDSIIPLDKYNLEIIDKNQKVIKVLSVNGNITSVFNWDGLDTTNKRVADDTYFGRIKGEFVNGNRVTSTTSEIVLDTKKPIVTVKLKERFNVFSPNGDGKKDYLTFLQTTSDEVMWNGDISNQTGEVVYTSSWSGIAPAEFIFNGKNMENINLTDGKYFYVLHATDSAGNVGISNKIELDIDTEDVDVFVSTDSTHFSPNADGVKDILTITPQLKKVDGIDSALYEVLNAELVPVFSKTITENFIQTVTWNGRGSGARLADGDYSVKLTVNYKRGDSPIATTNVVLDTKAPTGQVITQDRTFSPNGDGNRDFVVIDNVSEDIALWKLVIKDNNSVVVKENIVNGLVTSNWNFDGRGEDLTILPNGKYIYTLQGSDLAGNSYESENIIINMDNSISTAIVTNNYEVFSPNRDGVKDKVTFTPRIDSESPVESWTFTIVDNSGKNIKEFKGNKMPKTIIWTGEGEDSAVMATDAAYKGQLEIIHANGNNPTAATPNFYLDSKYPVISLTAKNKLFSPNGDNLKDSVILTQRGTGEELYHGRVISDDNRLIKEWFWKNSLVTLNWDGKDTSGNISEDGIYKYVVDVTDNGGNKTTKSIDNIEIDTVDTDIFITYKKPVFAPDLVNKNGPQVFGLIVNNRKGIESWSINITDSKEKLIKVLKGSKDIPETIDWNGKDSEGKNSNGLLKAKFNVVYSKGNSPVYLTKQFIADSIAPLVKVTTSPSPFSPDNDYVDDELFIELGVKDLSAIESWSFDIKDPKGNNFISFQGEGKPGKKIIWDGKSSKGELVQAAEEYNYVMSVKDVAGHIGITKGEIPVDILVIREGDKLKIKVSSIIFQPNSAVLALSGANGESNKKILKRLSEILDKYSSYKIIVEGHANNIYGNEVTKGQKKGLIDFSKERAEQVKKSLKKLGISNNRMSTIGIGGEEPVVSVYDHENTWKNRRVEFILVK
ncbi:MAG: gliding motility-associated C-terminal domain-containing protein [Spirochaetaceae bacterium]